MSRPFALSHVMPLAADMPLSYRKTLNHNEKLEDADEKDKLLRACHKRCADRTLKAMEKNGGIFIKLGQHLVRLPRTLDATQTTIA